MPTPRHGKNTRVFYGAYDLSLFLKEVSFPRQVDTAETTAFTVAAKEYVIGNPSGNISATGMFSYNNSAPNADIVNVLDAAFGQDAGSPVSVALDAGVTVGKMMHGGDALQSSYGITSSVQDVVGVAADFQLSGTAARGIALKDPDVVQACAGSNITGTGQDCSATLPGIATQFLLGGAAVLHVISNTVNAAVTIKLQSSATLGGAYVDLVSFTACGVASLLGEVKAIARGTVIDKFLRYYITTTGTGNIKFLTYFAPAQA